MKKLLSAGIDIGTSTTMVVFSLISVEDLSGGNGMPAAKITGKEVIYRSAVHFTPLVSNTMLDSKRIKEIVQDAYKDAGINASEVQTGAVIITGDTARKKNADNVLHEISHFAGNFVVAAAGPELESILAGKGSGADEFSKINSVSVTNVDIGGGTSNFATFHKGVVTDVDCMDIGGRLIRFRLGSMEIEYIFPKIKQLALELGVDADIGKVLDITDANKIAEAMAIVLLEKCCGGNKSERYFQLLTTPRNNAQEVVSDVISFSGGVGLLVYEEELPADFAFGDIGVLLARAIRSQVAAKGLQIVRPSETIGATVIGAGNHSTDISGSTVLLSPSCLPLQNIPILHVKEVCNLTTAEFSEVMLKNLQWIQGAEHEQNVALALDWGKDMRFADIVHFAEMIVAGAEPLLKEHDLLIVVLKKDYGKVLGHSLRLLLGEDKKILCLDGIDVTHGDYIDIGKPTGVGDALPIVVKTLALGY